MRIRRTVACHTRIQPDGVHVVKSSPQLSVILAGESIGPTDVLSIQLWGRLRLVCCLPEMVGAGPLYVLPEPTMASKAGCVLFGAQGALTAPRASSGLGSSEHHSEISAGMRQAVALETKDSSDTATIGGVRGPHIRLGYPSSHTDIQLSRTWNFRGFRASSVEILTS